MSKTKIMPLVLGVLLLMAMQAGSQTLRIMSYNIHHAQNESGVMDVKGLADFIVKMKPDLVALQEVDSMCKRSGRIDIAAELGRLTGMYYYFGKAMNYDGGGYGEAFLSRFPIQSISTVALPIQPNKNREPRAAIEAVMLLPNQKTIKLVATHLDHLDDETDRLMQTRFMADRYRQETMPFILIGDMNAEPGSAPIKQLMEVATAPALDKNQFTWPSGVPTKKIDYMLLSNNANWQCKKFEVPEEKHISDHRPVQMELRIK
ncbi:MAG TPA: endonuclease/exonuclease/phosphatase family protein [Phnomibacter sp.]|nr:endonuclease/exonuclease/phosphatase family protein [Phnomibacter sp.]